MPRERSFEVSAINIVIHPHSPARYLELIRRLGRMRTAVAVRGEYQAMIGTVAPIFEDDPEKGIWGEVWKFFELDPKSEWFNLVKHRRAEPDERKEIRIPPALKPHFSLFYYAFFPKQHLMIVETRSRGKSLSAGAVAKMLERLCERPAIAAEFGRVEVTVEPSAESLELIFQIPEIRRLRIEVSRPNADDLAEATREVMERLGKMNAERQVVELTAERHESLQPDDDIRTLAEVAQSNGEVEAEGFSNERRVYESTREHPLKETAKYDPNTQSSLEAFLTKARQLVSTILRRRR